MEKPPKISESENTKKVFNLPGKQRVEWELNPQTGEILNLAKKDAEGNTVEFYNLEREEVAQAYENYKKAISQPAKPKRKTPARQSPEQKAAEDKTSNNWQRYGKIHDPKTNIIVDLFYNPTTNNLLEVVKDENKQKLLSYTERNSEGAIINFENFEATSPSDLQAKLDRAKKDYEYFEDLKKLGWKKPTEQ